MKFFCCSAVLLLHTSDAFAPHQHTSSVSTTVLYGQKQPENGWFGPVATAFAGLTLASQVAFASPMPDVEPKCKPSPATPYQQELDPEVLIAISSNHLFVPIFVAVNNT